MHDITLFPHNNYDLQGLKIIIWYIIEDTNLQLSDSNETVWGCNKNC